MTWHDMGIGTPNGPNDPFCGHLWVHGVMELLDMVIVHEKAWNHCNHSYNGTFDDESWLGDD